MTGTDEDHEMPDGVLQHDTHGELDVKVQIMLGSALKAHYDDLVCCPIPDRFLALLAELEAKEKRDSL